MHGPQPDVLPTLLLLLLLLLTKTTSLQMECAQINVSGGAGTASPATYSIPGIYKATDPGVLVSVYQPNAGPNYVIPGPRPFSCSGGSTGTPPGTQPTTLTTSTTTSTATSKTPAPTQPPSCLAAQWAQCGGIGYTGCTTCASPYVCKKSSGTCSPPDRIARAFTG